VGPVQAVRAGPARRRHPLGPRGGRRRAAGAGRPARPTPPAAVGLTPRATHPPAPRPTRDRPSPGRRGDKLALPIPSAVGDNTSAAPGTTPGAVGSPRAPEGDSHART